MLVERIMSSSRLQAAGKAPWLFLFVVALAAFLRAFALGTESVWLDEAVSVKISGQSLPSIVESTATGDTNPPLYYILLRLWTLVFGQSEVAIRSLSACLGTASVVLIYKLGSLLFDRKVGIIGALLLAISPFAIYYSQEARHYSLLLSLTLLSFLLFARMLRADRRSTGLLISYFLVSVMLCYTHMFGLLTLGSQILYFLLFRRRYLKARLHVWAAQIATLAAFSPWVFVIVSEAYEEASHALDWVPEPSLIVVAEIVGALGGAGYLWRPLGAVFILALLLLCLAGVFSSSVSRRENGSDTEPQGNWRTGLLNSLREPRIALLLTWFLFPLLVTIIISLTTMSLLVSRYLIGITAAIYLLAALGISRVSLLLSSHSFRPNVVAGVLTALIVVISIPGLHEYYAYSQKDPWRDAAGFVEQGANSGDAIVFLPSYDEVPFAYYYGGAPEISIVSDETALGEDFGSTGQRVWLVLANDGAVKGSSARQQFLARYGNDSLVVQEEFAHTTVHLFARTGNP